MFGSLEKKKIYENSHLSFVFEFYSPIQKRELAAKFARGLGRKVKWFKEIDESYSPTNETFKLSPIYSGGFSALEFSTGFIPYHEAVHMMLKVMNVINELGYTGERTGVKVNVNLNEEALELNTSFDKINILKYLINVNEKKIFELWPENISERQKIYQDRLCFIHPKDLFYTILRPAMIERLDPRELNFPESDFFATDFSNLGKKYLSLSYIGGKNYQLKKKEAVEAINIVIENIYETLKSNQEYSTSDKRKIQEIVDNYQKVIDSTKTPERLMAMYPNISLFVDLKQNGFIIESKYELIRKDIFKLIAYGGMTEATINYDSVRQKLQIKGADIKKGILIEGIEFFESKIEADAKKCLFENCEVRNSKLNECTILSNNFIKFSKIIECTYSGSANEISSSYLDNSPDKMIHAEVRSCLVNKGVFSMDSSIDSATKIIKRV